MTFSKSDEEDVSPTDNRRLEPRIEEQEEEDTAGIIEESSSPKEVSFANNSKTDNILITKSRNNGEVITSDRQNDMKDIAEVKKSRLQKFNCFSCCRGNSASVAAGPDVESLAASEENIIEYEDKEKEKKKDAPDCFPKW